MGLLTLLTLQTKLYTNAKMNNTKIKPRNEFMYFSCLKDKECEIIRNKMQSETTDFAPAIAARLRTGPNNVV